MKKTKRSSALIVLLIFGGALLVRTDVFGADKELINTGKKLYETHCSICHGTKGDGKGAGGAMRWREKSGQTLSVQARDFSVGVFKFRDTATGCLPTDEDLMNIVTNGIPKSFMPSHRVLVQKDREAVVAYLKTFTKRWKEEEPCKKIGDSKPLWVGSSASAEKGKTVYKEMKCWECHGEKGLGDGPKADRLKDDWGARIFPFDFTTADLKRGTTPENIYMTFTTGLDGTGMPSYEDSLSEEDRWNLVSYTLKLMGD